MAVVRGTGTPAEARYHILVIDDRPNGMPPAAIGIGVTVARARQARDTRIIAIRGIIEFRLNGSRLVEIRSRSCSIVLVLHLGLGKDLSSRSVERRSGAFRKIDAGTGENAPIFQLLIGPVRPRLDANVIGASRALVIVIAVVIELSTANNNPSQQTVLRILNFGNLHGIALGLREERIVGRVIEIHHVMNFRIMVLVQQGQRRHYMALHHIDGLARIEALIRHVPIVAALVGATDLVGVAGDVGVSQELEVGHLARHVGADVLERALHLGVGAVGRGRRRLAVAHGNDVELEDIHVRRAQGVLGCRIAVDACRLGDEAHHEAVLLGPGHRVVGQLVSDRRVEQRRCVGLRHIGRRPHLGTTRRVGVMGVHQVPVAHDKGLLVVNQARIGSVRLAVDRRQVLGQHHGHNGQNQRAHLAAVHGVGVLAALVQVADLGVVALHGVDGCVVPPIAVLHVHVQLAHVALVLHIVFIGIGAHAVGADRVPGADERLAHNGLGARLGIHCRSCFGFLVLVGLPPHHGAVLLRRCQQRSRIGRPRPLRSLGCGQAGVVQHHLAAHARKIIGAPRGVVGTLARGRDARPSHETVVHIAHLHVVQVAVVLIGVGGRRGALVVVEVEHLEVGARAARALALGHIGSRSIAVVVGPQQHAVVPGRFVAIGGRIGEDARGNAHVDLVAGVTRVNVGIHRIAQCPYL